MLKNDTRPIRQHPNQTKTDLFGWIGAFTVYPSLFHEIPKEGLHAAAQQPKIFLKMEAECSLSLIWEFQLLLRWIIGTPIAKC